MLCKKTPKRYRFKSCQFLHLECMQLTTESIFNETLTCGYFARNSTKDGKSVKKNTSIEPLITYI